MSKTYNPAVPLPESKPTEPKFEFLTDEQRKVIQSKIEIHGIYTAMYERLFDINNETFHHFRRQYLKAYEQLTNFIES